MDIAEREHLNLTKEHIEEVWQGKRFEFGKARWQRGTCIRRASRSRS